MLTSGIPVFWAQAGGTQLTMGKVLYRTREHLGTTDLGIIGTRKKLINAAKALQEKGETRLGYTIRSGTRCALPPSRSRAARTGMRPPRRCGRSSRKSNQVGSDVWLQRSVSCRRV